MNIILNKVLDKSLTGYISLTTTLLVGGLLIWAGFKGNGFLFCFGTVLLSLSLAMLVFISFMSNQHDVMKIIKKDFSSENHAQLLALYEPYRVKNNHAVFASILGMAKKDVHEVERLTEKFGAHYDMRSFLDETGVLDK